MTRDGKSIDADRVPRLARLTLAEQSAEALRRLILLDELKPGAAIPERETAEALGVSRTPLREALRILANEGLVEIEALRPPRVANPSLDELKQLFDVQGALEALAGELVASNASEEDLESVALAATEAKARSGEGDEFAFFERDMAFHQAIVRATHNEPLIETHATYNRRLWRARFISSRRRVNRDRTLAEHDAIVGAIKNRNAKDAAAALRRHLRSAIENIGAVMGDVEPVEDAASSKVVEKEAI